MKEKKGEGKESRWGLCSWKEAVREERFLHPEVPSSAEIGQDIRELQSLGGEHSRQSAAAGTDGDPYRQCHGYAPPQPDRCPPGCMSTAQGPGAEAWASEVRLHERTEVNFVEMA